ncbi:hypothetical protein OG429_07280 [Streptomyces sp. NBC_00190]|uniref:hypothetical protein n=1 Tax=unclassified Streptomyces TaxID=2593676 RepID=UPI002E2D2091|nr:hypothetical protein [Streptomyces sp. NBC_00190]WSZ39155.1 hypothetical protein OG239_10275 [Streptomyces sp. NBC_00868]
METHEEREAPAREPGLTTEDLAHPGTAGERRASRDTAVYPGEATATDDDAAGDSPVEAASDANAVGGGTAEGEGKAEGEGERGTEPLLGSGEAEEYREKWSEIQGRFVDDPQDAVKAADSLVAEVMQNLAGTFATHKQGLESQWDRGEQVATEDLRLALQHYRSFFNRLLNT